METTVTIDGREVRFRATAAVPRLYRIKFRRDILEDFRTIQAEMEKAKENGQGGSTLPIQALTLFEDIAYIMAKHADKDAVPADPDEWLESFGTFSIYQIFPTLLALWTGNIEMMDVAKKKLDQSTGT